MKLTYKGNKVKSSSIQPLVEFLEQTENYKNWVYQGLTVELDPTVDFADENVLVRWTDIEEGFNDKILVYSLLQFQSLFKPTKLC